MKHILICLLTVLLLIYPDGNSSEAYPANAGEGIYALSNGDVTSSFTYLNDGQRNYGARFYLYNHIGSSVTVHWHFTGYSNVTSSGGFEGNDFIVGNGYVQITTMTQIDTSQAWSTGSIQFTWE